MCILFTRQDKDKVRAEANDDIAIVKPFYSNPKNTILTISTEVANLLKMFEFLHTDSIEIFRHFENKFWPLLSLGTNFVFAKLA